MAKVISIINNKGGVGKTSSTGILSELLAYLNLKVLCIDLDQQSNLSMMLKSYVEDSQEVIDEICQPKTENYNIAELFRYRYKNAEDVDALIKRTCIRNIDIIPSSKRHRNTQTHILVNTGNNNIILKRALAAVKDRYDFVLIDNAPASDILTVNSIFASDFILTPVRVEAFSYKGFKETLDTIAYIKEEHGLDSVKFLGIFITQVEANTNIYKDLKVSYSGELGNRFLRTPIRKDIKVAEVETLFEPLLKYNANTNAVYDYSKLLLELNILPDQAKEKLICAIGE